MYAVCIFVIILDLKATNNDNLLLGSTS